MKSNVFLIADDVIPLSKLLCSHRDLNSVSAMVIEKITLYFSSLNEGDFMNKGIAVVIDLEINLGESMYLAALSAVAANTNVGFG